MPCDKMPKNRMPKDEMPKRQNAFSKKVPDDRMPTETQCIMPDVVTILVNRSSLTTDWLSFFLGYIPAYERLISLKHYSVKGTNIWKICTAMYGKLVSYYSIFLSVTVLMGQIYEKQYSNVLYSKCR